jgi:hypothetical protein
MGILKNCNLGTPSGKIGNLIYRNFGGKTYVSVCPINPKVSKSEKVRLNKYKFCLFSVLATALWRDFLINTLWNQSDLPGLTFRGKLVKANFKFFTLEGDLTLTPLFPVPTCFDGSVLSAEFEPGGIKIIIQPGDEVNHISEIVYPDIYAHGVIRLTDNAEVDPKPITFIPLTSTGVVFQKGVPLEFHIPLLGELMPLVESYPVRTFTAGLAISSVNGGASFLSSNITGVF